MALVKPLVNDALDVSRVRAGPVRRETGAHWWKLYGCGVVEMGRLWTEGEGIAIPSREDSQVYASTGPRLGVEVPFAPHLRLRVFGEIFGILMPVEIPVDECPVWTAPRVAGGVGAGFSFCL